MKRFFIAGIAITFVLFAATSVAATKTVTLAVANMTCPVCPITVKKALNAVAGVNKTTVSLERKEATVTFDDSKTNVQTLIKATTNAGYPSKLTAK